MSGSSQFFPKPSDEKTSTALSTHVHAPSDIGFIHTSADCFTYFSGSDAGICKTFGMPVAELADRVNKFTEDFAKQESKCKAAVAGELVVQLAILREELKSLASRFKNNEIYNVTEDQRRDGLLEMNEALLKTG